MKVLLAVSGGIDSMYMLHRAPELFPGASFAVAHCNFRLRGEESDADEAFVVRECGRSGIPCFVQRFDTLGYASEKGISVEMAARELRYGWFEKLRVETGADKIATAHNACDNAETLILNLLRGTGTKGMRGIPAASGSIVRPLLGTERDEILRWMQEKGLGWREDSTNAESDFKRNKIRNLVFPLFADINPSFIRTLEEDMERIRQTDDIADEYYRSAASQIVSGGDGAVEIKVMGLLALKHWRYVLWRIIEGCSFSAPTFGKLCILLEKYRTQKPGTVTLSGKKFESPSHIIEARRRILIVKKRES